jgi:hypothetical protein
MAEIPQCHVAAGDWFDVCSCDIACSCIFGQPPVVAGHVGADCIGRAVFLTDDLDRFIRGVLVHVGAQYLRAFAGE